MHRLIYEEKKFWLFGENNWTLVTNVTAFIRVRIINTLDRYNYFPNVSKNYYNYLLQLPNGGYSYIDYMCLVEYSKCGIFPKGLMQVSEYACSFLRIDPSSGIFNYYAFSLLHFLATNYFIYEIFLIMYVLFLLFGFTKDFWKSYLKTSNLLIYYKKFLLVWTSVTGIKFESYEETLCVIVIWPWCIFLIFTHVLYLEDNEIFFIFIEWGTPVLLGLMFLVEFAWIVTCHCLMYLVGSGENTRKSIILVFVDDLMAFFILLSRVCLQFVRGLVCSLYHDFFREIYEILTYKWDVSYFFIDFYEVTTNPNFLIRVLFILMEFYILFFIFFFSYFSFCFYN